MRTILIIDNHVGNVCHDCYRFREHIKAKYKVVVSTVDQLPEKISNYSHVVLTGGSGRLDYQDERAQHLMVFIRHVVESGVPIFGICFGHQAILVALNHRQEVTLEQYQHPAFGWNRIHRNGSSRLLNDLPKVFYGFEHHLADAVHLPDDFVITAWSRRTKIEAYEHKTKPIFGVQFHPDVKLRYARHLMSVFFRNRWPRQWLADPDEKHYSPAINQKIFANFYAIKKSTEEPAIDKD